MKKKIFMSATAVAMILSMSVTAIAAPTARESGDVDKNNVVNSNDASIIAGSRTAGEHIDNGTFDGFWNNLDYKMTGNGDKVITYALTPENMTEGVAVRAYASSNSQSDGGFAGNFIVDLATDLELDSTKNYDGTYTNYDAKLSESTNPTIDELITNAVNKIDASADSVEELGKFLSGVQFEGFGKNTGKAVSLTNDDGWGVFAVAMRDIVPISADDFANSGYEGNTDAVFDGNYGVIDAPYTSLDEIADPELRARAEAFQELKAMIVTNTEHSEGQNNTNLTSAVAAYDAFKQAFPSDVTEAEFRKTVDHFAEIYTRRYSVSVTDKDGNEVIDGNDTGVNTTEFVNKLINNGIYHYETATLQDLRDTFGDRIELSTTKDGEKTWGFVVELYVTYAQK